MKVNLKCGDCIEMLKYVPDCSIDCIITDPPYKTITGGNTGDRPRGMLSGNGELFVHQNDIKICDWFPLIYRVLKEGTHAYVFTNFINLNEMMTEAAKCGFGLHNLLCWEKNNKTPSQYYMKNCEYVLFLRKGKAKWINNIGQSSTVHKFNNIIGNKTHPCEKPTDLLKFYIENSTVEGEVVLDPFMGTGSCGIACIETNRSFIGIEKDERYFEIARKRVDKMQHMPRQPLMEI